MLPYFVPIRTIIEDFNLFENGSLFKKGRNRKIAKRITGSSKVKIISQSDINKIKIK